MRKLQVGLVGAGYVSSFHTNGWRKTGAAEVSAICARRESQASKRAKELSIPESYSDIERMLDGARIDVLDVITPPETHLKIVAEAARRGIHVMCQKPLAPSMEEAQSIVATAKEADIQFMVHENWRFRPWYRELSGVLRQGLLGDIFYAHFNGRFAGTVLSQEHPETPFSLERQPFFSDMPRFLVYEALIHQLDVTRFLFGEPLSIYARTHRVSSQVKGEDVVTAVLAYKGSTSVLERSYGSKGHAPPPMLNEQVVIEGREGSAFIDHDGQLRVVLDGAAGRREIRPAYPLKNAYAESYAATIAHFVESFWMQVPFETCGEDNLRTLALVFAAYRSAETNRVVTAEEIQSLSGEKDSL